MRCHGAKPGFHDVQRHVCSLIIQDTLSLKQWHPRNPTDTSRHSSQGKRAQPERQQLSMPNRAFHAPSILDLANTHRAGLSKANQGASFGDLDRVPSYLGVLNAWGCPVLCHCHPTRASISTSFSNRPEIDNCGWMCVPGPASAIRESCCTKCPVSVAGRRLILFLYGHRLSSF